MLVISPILILFSSSLHINICDHDDIREVLETGVDLKTCIAWVANNSSITPMALGNRCFGIVVQLQLGYIFSINDVIAQRSIVGAYT